LESSREEDAEEEEAATDLDVVEVIVDYETGEVTTSNVRTRTRSPPLNDSD
jgi:hypothetical protein